MLYVRAELPGLTQENINIELVNGYLSINGTRKVTDDDGKVTESIALNRSIAVPEAVLADKISAEMKDGILRLTLPKAAAVKPRKIAIN